MEILKNMSSVIITIVNSQIDNNNDTNKETVLPTESHINETNKNNL